MAMGGTYDFLDGLVVANTCDHVRRLYDVYKRKLGDPIPLYFLSLPHVVSAEGEAWVVEEFKRLLDQLASATGAGVTDADVGRSMEEYTRNERLLGRLQELRTADPPKVSGREFVALAVANASVPVEFANEQLERVVRAVEKRPALRAPRARLLLAGSYVDDPSFVGVLEHSGALVVVDNLCTSLRGQARAQTADDAAPGAQDDPVTRLAWKYYRQEICPRVMNQFPRRLALVDRLLAEGVDGVVLQRLEFCDLHGNENMLLQHALKRRGVPMLNVDREYFTGDAGRLKTRVEAFVEKIERTKEKRKRESDEDARSEKVR